MRPILTEKILIRDESLLWTRGLLHVNRLRVIKVGLNHPTELVNGNVNKSR